MPFPMKRFFRSSKKSKGKDIGITTTDDNTSTELMNNIDHDDDDNDNDNVIDNNRFPKMEAMDLFDDLIEFLEEHARFSPIFAAILDYSDVYINDIPRLIPPASSYAKSKLPIYRVYPFDKNRYGNFTQECAICQECLLDGFAVTRLPCGHLYHMNCAFHWLDSSCLCPICRYEMETSHPHYEIGRKQRMRHVPTYSCSCSSHQSTSNRHRCFLPTETDGVISSDYCGNLPIAASVPPSTSQSSTSSKLATRLKSSSVSSSSSIPMNMDGLVASAVNAQAA